MGFKFKNAGFFKQFHVFIDDNSHFESFIRLQYLLRLHSTIAMPSVRWLYIPNDERHLSREVGEQYSI